MAKKRKRHDEEAWRNAKTLCRLSARQVEMARALGMNPKKLPGLRPSPQQRWKLPVGKFIEECYQKRFCGKESRNEPPDPNARRRAPQPSLEPVEPVEPINTPRDHRQQLDRLLRLASYCMNLAHDLDDWVQHGGVDADLLPQIAAELREIADALESDAIVPEMPEIPAPPPRRRRPPRSRRHVPPLDDDKIPVDDDEIPF